MQFRIFILLNLIAIQAIYAQPAWKARAAARRDKGNQDKVDDCSNRFRKNSSAKYYDDDVRKAFCERIAHWQTTANETKQQGGFRKPGGTQKQKEFFAKQEAKAASHQGVAPSGSSNTTAEPPFRKEYRCLTDQERQDYHTAVKAMMTTMIDNMTEYRIFVEYHPTQISPGAHGGHSFPPWHRHYLYLFELAMQDHVPNVTLPYWASYLDELLPVTADSIIFSDEFMGPGIGMVNSGPFANVDAPNDPTCPVPNKLCRQVSDGGSLLYDESIINFAETRTHFTALSACEDSYFEGVHGGPHICVGGQMDSIPTAPGDPIFFLHHGFVDYLFEHFRQSAQTREERETDYPSTCDCSAQCNPEDDALPFDGIINKDGISNEYTDVHYQYQKHPTCNGTTSPECDPPSKYLFCYNGSRCVSKVKPGGSCVGFENTPICYESTCTAGVCVPSGGRSTSGRSVRTTSRSTRRTRSGSTLGRTVVSGFGTKSTSRITLGGTGTSEQYITVEPTVRSTYRPY